MYFCNDKIIIYKISQVRRRIKNKTCGNKKGGVNDKMESLTSFEYEDEIKKRSITLPAAY